MERAIKPELRVFPDQEALAEAAARMWREAAEGAVAERGKFQVVLSGGSTPRALYRLLAQPPWHSLPWTETEIFWGDERHVPPYDAASNQRLAREALLDRAPIPAANIHPMPTASAPESDAAAYEAQLRQVFSGCEWPAFDLAWLGLGEDGHTASLFPGDAATKEKTRWATAAHAPAGISDRITLTAPALNAARQVVFLVSGAAKADILREVLQGRLSALDAPAKLIKPVSGRLCFLADRDAAGALR